MSILTVEHVNHDFGGRTILEDASFRLLKGEHVGLVGANGEGKSTFLNIITGKLMPDSGNVEWCNRITTGYLDQHSALENGKTIREILKDAFKHMFELEEEMLGLYEKMGEVSEDELHAIMEDVSDIQHTLDHNGFYLLDAKIEEVANGLGLGAVGLDKDVTELSGGQRTKVLLAKLLLESPMILILDEPTNFLDYEHIVWLKQFLIDYENAFILVSHDTTFLNEVTNVIYHLENAILSRYKGDYENFMRMYDLKRRQQEQSYEKQQKEIDKLETFIAKNKARVATTNMAKSRQKQLDKMERVEKVTEKVKPNFSFKEARASARFVVETKGLVIGYDTPLTKPLDLRLERGQKVALMGVNGLGKSTLLKTLLGIIKPVSGEVHLGDYLEKGYFEQESSYDNKRTALEELWAEFPSMTNREVRAALARSGLTNEHITSLMMVLSGGEAAKVRLTKIMLRECNWLVLDEPTNHLDVDAKEELQRALMEFKGTILLVSHDPEFYKPFITDVWSAEDWTLKIV